MQTFCWCDSKPEQQDRLTVLGPCSGFRSIRTSESVWNIPAQSYTQHLQRPHTGRVWTLASALASPRQSRDDAAPGLRTFRATLGIIPDGAGGEGTPSLHNSRPTIRSGRNGHRRSVGAGEARKKVKRRRTRREEREEEREQLSGTRSRNRKLFSC